jgi:hypothetical protein
MSDIRYREVKIDPETIADLQHKDTMVVDMIGRLTAKVGYVQRGNVVVSGGMTPGAYSMGGTDVASIGDENREDPNALVDKDRLAKMMRDEMRKPEAIAA